MSVVDKPKHWYFKLRSILLAVNFILVLLPVGGIVFFRIYENELVQQTELELISQAAFIASIYKQEISLVLQSRGAQEKYGIPVSAAAPDGARYLPVTPQLNLSSHKILPRPEGAMAAEVQADNAGLEAGAHMTPILEDAQRTVLSGIRILDYRGVVVAGPADLGLSMAHLDEVRRALTGRYASAIRARLLKHPMPPLASISRGTGIRVFVAFPIVKNDRLMGVVLLSRTPRSILEHLYSERETVALVGAGLVLLAAGLAFFTSYTIARPIHALIRQTRGIARGNKAALEPLKSPVTEELGLLSQSFADMARALEHRSDYIRHFATQVSHEFKTPLAGIRGAVELLQEHIADMPPEKRDRFLANVAHDANRLQRLVDRLLEMARADVLEPGSETADVPSLLAPLTERYKELDLTITVIPPDLSMKARIAPDVLETVFVNLLDNSRQNGADHVTIDCRRTGGNCLITVSDNGGGISGANAEKIFMPFFTTHREDGGTGLGLGIVKSLLTAHHGGISLINGAGGAVFLISIPGIGPI
ncbi:MAG TPA: ATP-binding protein [Candidatus Binatia bacterium]|jgi:signal transduction histidine kinase